MNYLEFSAVISEMDRNDLENFAIDLYYTLAIERVSAGLIEPTQIIPFSRPCEVKIARKNYDGIEIPMFSNNGVPIGKEGGNKLAVALGDDDLYEKMFSILQEYSQKQ